LLKMNGKLALSLKISNYITLEDRHKISEIISDAMDNLRSALIAYGVNFESDEVLMIAFSDEEDAFFEVQ
jgi:hypothetical protein